MIPQLLALAVRLSGIPAHRHPCRQVMAFHIRRANVAHRWEPGDYRPFRPRVLAPLSLVLPDQLGVIDLTPEVSLDSLNVGIQAISDDCYAPGQPPLEIGHKLGGNPLVPVAARGGGNCITGDTAEFPFSGWQIALSKALAAGQYKASHAAGDNGATMSASSLRRQSFPCPESMQFPQSATAGRYQLC